MVVLFTFQVFKKNVSKAEAGENVGILLRGIRIETLERGMVLCALGSKELVNRFVIVCLMGILWATSCMDLIMSIKSCVLVYAVWWKVRDDSKTEFQLIF